MTELKLSKIRVSDMTNAEKISIIDNTDPRDEEKYTLIQLKEHYILTGGILGSENIELSKKQVKAVFMNMVRKLTIVFDYEGMSNITMIKYTFEIL